MKLKFNILTLFLIICILLSVSSAAASDDLVADEIFDSSQDDAIISQINEEDDSSNEVVSSSDSSNDDELKDTNENTLKADSSLSFSDLADKINSQSEGELEIEGTYKYNASKDSAYKDGIVINKENNFKIKGKNLIIDGNNTSMLNFTGSHNIELYNATIRYCQVNNFNTALLNLSSDINAPKTYTNVSFNNYGNFELYSISFSQYSYITNNGKLNSFNGNYYTIRVFNYGDYDFVNCNITFGILNNSANLTTVNCNYSAGTRHNYGNFLTVGGRYYNGGSTYNSGNYTVSNCTSVSGVSFYNNNNTLKIENSYVIGGTYYNYENGLLNTRNNNFTNNPSLNNYGVMVSDGDTFNKSSSSGSFRLYNYATLNMTNSDFYNYYGSASYMTIRNEYGAVLNFNGNCSLYRLYLYSYGNVSFNGNNSLNYSINLNNYGNMSIYGNNSFYSTYFNGNNQKGNLSIEGNNNFNSSSINSNNVNISGQNTFENVYFSNSDVENTGLMSINRSQMYTGDFTNNGGTVNSSNNIFASNIKNNGSMSSVNDAYNFQTSTNYVMTTSYGQFSNYDKMTIENATTNGAYIYNIGGELTANNNNFNGGKISNFEKGTLNLNNNNLSSTNVTNKYATVNSNNDSYDYSHIINNQESEFNLSKATVNNSAIENVGNFNVVSSSMNNIAVDNQNVAKLNVEESSLDNVNITNNNRATVTFKGSNIYTNSNVTGGSLVNDGALTATNVQMTGNKAEGTGVKNNGEMTLTNSNITNNVVTNEGTLDLTDSNLEDVDVVNRGNLNVDGGSVTGTNVYNDGGKISGSNPDIASNVKEVTPIVAKNITTTYDSGVFFGANLTDAFGNKLSNQVITFIVDGTSYEAKTDSKGYAFLNKQLAAGKHNITVVNSVAGVSKDYVFTINKLSSKVTVGKIVEYYGARKYLTIKIVDKDGKGIKGIKFTVKFNKKTYTLTSDASGNAKIKIPVLKVGSYAVTVSASSPKYTVPNAKSTIKVNKAKTTVKAPKVTAKAKKSKYFKITIKSKVTKKVVKNVKIKVKVYTGKKFKTYKLKTNKKGVAKLNTKKLKKGKHKVVISSLNKNYTISKKSLITIK